VANASAAKGTRFELKVRDDLRKRGYFVMRSPASKSVIDLLAVDHRDVLFVQCKTNARLDPVEWNELFDLAMDKGGVPLMASKPSRGEIRYQRLIGRKDGPGRQPLDEWSPE
jgi:Holliday junction resolvase